jgi:hypothetical protein
MSLGLAQRLVPKKFDLKALGLQHVRIRELLALHLDLLLNPFSAFADFNDLSLQLLAEFVLVFFEGDHDVLFFPDLFAQLQLDFSVGEQESSYLRS